MSRDVGPGARKGRGALVGVLLLATVTSLSGTGCSSGGEEPALPSDSDLEGLYGGKAQLRLNGNVVDVRVVQEPVQLERGGPLWAKVGPYIFLFSPQTQELFEEYPGVAAVRARTFTEAGELIAEATLRHDELNAITWKKARSLVARARREGTDKPGYLESLVGYGEDHTTYEYNRSFVKS